ncbi:hypothetical protein [Campylobacter sp. US33a]|uniref:hypothetical protein n=1 Tax=Campylobacter sp. US33a TaxID=2498120 RepID=UPI001067FC20|nr:hypothetical protein [Campylobacter sp. US33a]TEY02323.1 hypothetical protein ELQ16_05445 [Campylobacter sp. US33a]
MLNVYIDNSGSMYEMDKIEVAKYVAYAISNATFYLLNGNQIRLDFIALDNDNNLCIEAEGRKILLSDGLFNCDEKKFDIALAIGLDADIEALKKMADTVYTIDNIMSFLDSVNMNLSTDDEDNSWE